MFSDPYAKKVGVDDQSYLGALISFLGAGFGAIQGYMNHKATHLHPIVRMHQFFIFSVVYQMVFFPIFIQNSKFYSMDPEYGAFGWLSSWHNFIQVF